MPEFRTGCRNAADGNDPPADTEARFLLISANLVPLFVHVSFDRSAAMSACVGTAADRERDRARVNFALTAEKVGRMCAAAILRSNSDVLGSPGAYQERTRGASLRDSGRVGGADHDLTGAIKLGRWPCCRVQPTTHMANCQNPSQSEMGVGVYGKRRDPWAMWLNPHLPARPTPPPALPETD